MKRITLQFAFIFCVIHAFAQQVIEPDTVIQRFLTQTRLYPQENIYLHTDKSDYVAGDTIWFRAYTVNAISRKEENMSRYVYVQLIDGEAGQTMIQVKARKDSCDKIHGYLPIAPTLPRGSYQLRAYTYYGLNWGEEGSFSKAIHIYTGHKKQEQDYPKSKATYHADFMPEGGQAIDGQPCRIAFRAQSSSGKGENIRGTVIDEQKDTLLHFQSLHHGMGHFQITPDKAKTYYALCTNDSGQVKRFTLPQAIEGAALSIQSDSAHCHVSLVHSPNIATDSLQLAILQRGHPCFAGWWNPSHGRMSFSLQEFDEGIAHFLLLSPAGNILSQRLLFINHPEACKISLTPDTPAYAPRKRIEIAMTLETGDSIANGDCSIAITDANDVPADETVNIRSALLLTADLSGNIEQPGWYFKGTEPDKEKEGLDLLMLTHGWRRYDLQQTLKGNYAQPALLPEVSMQFSGRVETMFGKPLPNGMVQIHVQRTSFLESTKTDDKGNFVFNGFEFPDSLKYFITAKSAKGRKNVVLKIDSIRSLKPVPRPLQWRLHLAAARRKAVTDEDSYIRKSIGQLSNDEQIRHYLLGEVKVTAPYVKKYKSEFERDAQITVREDRIKQSGALDLATLIRSTTGLNPNGAMNTDGATNTDAELTLVLDGSLIENQAARWLLQTFEVSNVQQIDVIKHAKTIGYFDGKKGTIVAITTKSGGAEYNARYIDTNMATLIPLGYQEPIERYTPHYDSPTVQTAMPDQRTTLYWKPDVAIKDGKATVSFYTADSPSRYRVVVEGISSEGKVFRKENCIF